MIDFEANLDTIYYLDNSNDCEGAAATKRDSSRKDKKIPMIGGSNALSSTDKSLGTWMFDKRTKKRKYSKLYAFLFEITLHFHLL